MWSHKVASEAPRCRFFKLEVSDPRVFSTVKVQLMDARPLGKMVKTAVDWDGTQWLPEAVLFKWREPATARSFHAWVTSHMPPGVGDLTNGVAAHQTEQHSKAQDGGKAPAGYLGSGRRGMVANFWAGGRRAQQSLTVPLGWEPGRAEALAASVFACFAQPGEF